MENEIFESLCIIRDKYREMGKEKLKELVGAGRELVDFHLIENLQYKLKTED